LVRFDVTAQARNQTRPDSAMSCSPHGFFLWLPGDDLVFFVRVKVKIDRTRHLCGFLSPKVYLGDAFAVTQENTALLSAPR
jgi:hypothetical protein